MTASIRPSPFERSFGYRRVLFTSPTWRMNGVNVFTLNLGRGLARLGFEPEVVVTRPGRHEKVPLERPADLPVVDLAVPPEAPHVARWRALRRRLRACAPCVYFPNYDTATSCVSPRLPDDVIVVGVVHGDDPQHYEHFERLGHTWNVVAAVSERIATALVEISPEADRRLVRIPNGVPVPPERGHPPGDPERPLRVLYAGLLKHQPKGVLDLPEVVEIAVARGARVVLTIAGGGEDEPRLRERCRGLVERGLVEFAGVLSRGEIAAAFAEHDALLLVSRSEGLPNALLEAMAAGCVPVTTAVASGVDEVVTGGLNGLTAPVGDTAGSRRSS